jgi:hypothetical protein
VHRMFLCLALILSASLGAIAIAKEAQPRTTEEAQVICTRTGCVPLPRGCSTNREEASGYPTGYESAICAPGISPRK